MIPLVLLAVITNTDEVRACLPLATADVMVGTGGGLVRGDRVLTASDGLPGTRIDNLVADPRDASRIWVATDGGVASVDASTLAIGDVHAGRPVRDVARLGNTIYLATWDGGVVELGSNEALPMHGGNAAARMRVSSLVVADGVLYAGTAAGLFALRGGKLERVDGTGAPTEVASLAADGAALWIGTPDGLSRRDGNAFHALGGGDVRRVAIVGGAVVIAGDGGLRTVARDRVVAMTAAPAIGLAQALGSRGDATCAGGLDGLWTRSGGAAWAHVAARGGIPSNDVSALAADGDTMWVGTFDQGVATHDAHGWHRVTAPGLDARINAIVVAPDAIWIGTAEGVIAMQRDGRVVVDLHKRDGLPGRNVISLARLADGRVVAGTSQGAAFVDGGRVVRVGPRVASEQSIGNVWAVAEGTNHTLWLGTTTGLYHGPATGWTVKDGGAHDADGVWKRHSVASGDLRDDWVTALAPKGDAVWVGTYKGGVTKIDDRGVAAQLGDGWVNPGGLTWDGEQLAVSTMDGVRVGNGGGTWTALRDLPGRDSTATARAGRTVWVATRRGVVLR